MENTDISATSLNRSKYKNKAHRDAFVSEIIGEASRQKDLPYEKLAEDFNKINKESTAKYQGALRLLTYLLHGRPSHLRPVLMTGEDELELSRIYQEVFSKGEINTKPQLDEFIKRLENSKGELLRKASRDYYIPSKGENLS